MSTQSPATSHNAIASGISATDGMMLLVVLIWGANFSIVKAALVQIPPLAFTALRFGLGAIALALVLRVREGKGALSLPRDNRWRLVWLGIVGNTVYQIFFILGLARTTAANSALMLAAMPVIVAVLGALLGIERITRTVGWGIALAFGGITMVLTARGIAISLDTLPGDLLILAGVVCWSVYTLGVRALGGGLSPLRITTLTLLTGTPGLLLAGIPELLHLDWAQVGATAWGGILYAGLLALVLAYMLWNSSVRLAGSSRTAIYSCVTPLVATLVAWLVLGERPVPLQGIGAVLIVAGVLMTRRKAIE